MTKIRSSPTRNVENIRRKNVEDNQLFLEKLLINDIRKGFLSSARSILRQNGSDQIKKHFPRPYEKVERTTRYSEKVKFGEIDPFVPEWQRLLEKKKQEAERRSLEKERRSLEKGRRSLEQERRKLEIEQKKEVYEQKRQEILLNKELRKIEREIQIEEEIRIRIANRRPPKPTIWAVYEKNNPYPYQQSFKPRHTKTGEQAEQNFV